MTLVTLVPNGSMVREGDPLAEFDQTEQLEASREAQAKYEDLSHQVEQKEAENAADQAKRKLDQREAESDLKEARIELRKGPLLSEIDRLKNETKAKAAEERVASLAKSDAFHVEAEAAALRVLELQRDRQQVALERAQNNLSKLRVLAPLSGMVAHEAIWRNGSMGPPQEGDQLYPGQALLRIFDPSEMEVLAHVAEPDGAALKPGCRAVVSLDAYPELRIHRAARLGEPGGGVGDRQSDQNLSGSLPPGADRPASASGSFRRRGAVRRTAGGTAMSVSSHSTIAEEPQAAQAPVVQPRTGPPLPPGRSRRLWKWIATLLGLGLLAGAGLYRFRAADIGPVLPTAHARSGEFLTIIRCRGELVARRSAQIVAPVNVPELRIIWLAPAGEPVEAGSVVVRFDPSSAQQQLAEKRASLEQAQATLDHADAEARITAEQDRLDLSNARYEVEKARLEVSKAEILSAMQAEQSQIALDLADQKLKVEEATVHLHEASSQAKSASLARARDEAKAQLELTEYRLSQMELKAPISGVIVFQENHSQGWLNAQPFKVGDQVWPGGTLAEIPDLVDARDGGQARRDRSRQG